MTKARTDADDAASHAEYEEFDDREYVDDEDDTLFDCALDPESGQCGMAGSEDCDWECPNRNSEWFAGSRAYCQKHNQLFYAEVELARHALGLTGDKKLSYRNYYTVAEGAPEYETWMSIVAKGLAIRIDKRNIMGGDWLFHLTREGAEQSLYEGEELDPEDFPASLNRASSPNTPPPETPNAV